METYRPWVKLLLDVAQSRKIPNGQKKQVGEAIGFKIHEPYGMMTRLSLQLAARNRTKYGREDPFFYFDEERQCIVRYHRGEESCYRTAEELEQFLINQKFLAEKLGE